MISRSVDMPRGARVRRQLVTHTLHCSLRCAILGAWVPLNIPPLDHQGRPHSQFLDTLLHGSAHARNPWGDFVLPPFTSFGGLASSLQVIGLQTPLPELVLSMTDTYKQASGEFNFLFVGSGGRGVKDSRQGTIRSHNHIKN